ncbi:MAG TPA: HAD family hydrolase, partial [Nocardioides sp.]|nr:HAD family hydrolase [Nocardioides sp.]
GLAVAHEVPEDDGEVIAQGGWRARVEGGLLRVDGAGGADAWWRVVAVASWRHLDATGGPVATDGIAPPG